MPNPISLAILLCLAAGLSSAGAQPASGSDVQLPSASLPAELDRVLRDYERAWRSGDASSVAALFSVDGFVLQSGRAPVRGRDAIAKAYAGQGGGELQLRAFAYAVADTVGYIIGGYRYGNAQSDIGKYTLTLRRPRGGRWEIFSDMDNGNQQRRQGAPSPGPVQ